MELGRRITERIAQEYSAPEQPIVMEILKATCGERLRECYRTSSS